MEIVGWILAFIIGITLGLLGGGGSILTVPVLVYLLDVDPVPATGYSLFIVGLSALVGTVAYFRKGLVDVRTALIFGLPAITSVYLTRKVLIPAMPEHLFQVGDFEMTKDIAIMVLFALLMVGASYSMIKKHKEVEVHAPVRGKSILILLEGVVVGVLTGMVGAGGGFLIIPALVIFTGLSMKMAVGTSLLIIGVKSLIGFIGDVQNHVIDWTFLLTFAAFSVVGIFVGSMLAHRISGAKLKPAFGWFILAMGVYILGRELFM